jgi:hypothetical protein
MSGLKWLEVVAAEVRREDPASKVVPHHSVRCWCRAVVAVVIGGPLVPLVA